ncbi:hypothetical protein SUDANB95_07926 (plasmid) [Actinosynnema sp. ALI-1.44]
MTVWTGQIIAAAVFTAVFVAASVIGVRRRDRRFVALVAAFGTIQLTMSISIIVMTA